MNGTLITIDPGAELFWRSLFEYGPAVLVVICIALAIWLRNLRRRGF